MKYLLLSVLLIFSLVGFSQSSSIKTIFKQADPKATVKIIIDMSDYDPNKIIAFKDRLTMYKGKIEIAHYNDSSSLLTIVYNEFMSLNEFINVFDKYGISYQIKNAMVYSNN